LVLGLFRAPGDPPPAPAGAHGSVEVFRASPRFLRYRLIGIVIGAVVLVISTFVELVIGLAIDEPWLAGLAIPVFFISGAGLLLGYFLIHLDYDLRYYVFTDRSLRVREGAWSVREKTLTYVNVQNLRVVQGPLQRVFGIRDLCVDTAGGGGGQSEGKSLGKGHNVSIAGVENAIELRDRILAHMKAKGAGSGLGDPDDESPGTLASPQVLTALRGVSDAARALREAAAAG
jgi:membrane protein YdbS with pleckstrin-like domain